jgi:hypothetical protein
MLTIPDILCLIDKNQKEKLFILPKHSSLINYQPARSAAQAEIEEKSLILPKLLLTLFLTIFTIPLSR